MIKKDLSKQDKKDWKEFLDNLSSVPNKDKLDDQKSDITKRFKFDFHGYTLDQANKKITSGLSEFHSESETIGIFVIGVIHPILVGELS